MSERVELREVEDGDLPSFFEHQQDREAVNMAAFTSKDPSDRAAFFAHWKKIRTSAAVTIRSVLVDGRLAGHVASFGRAGEREVTYWLGREHWGRGVATRALRAFLDVEKERPLHARVAKDNERSRRVLEKCGFAFAREERGFAEARRAEIAELVLRLDTRFAKLHEAGCFVIPNPWDPGSAKALAKLGFEALATSSAGYGFARGLPDSPTALDVDAVLAHCREIVAATDLPVNADFQNGYALDAAGVAANVRRCVATGVAGLSIEDATGDKAKPLHDLSEAVERLRAARAAIDATRPGVLLTGRAEAYLVGHPEPLEDVLKRLVAYAEAGADVLFAPGARRLEDVSAIVKAVAPKPVNVLVGASYGVKVADLAALGVRRVSVGSSLARAAWTGFLRAARSIAEQGSFEGFEGITSFAELNAMFGG